jgi:HPt (histidine-containing phosphotransfer) domain-containing protein
MPEDKAVVRHFRVKTKLRQRLGIPPGMSDAQSPFEGAEMQVAQAVLARLSSEFPKHGLQEVDKLRSAVAHNPVLAQNIAELKHTAHDLAGQGGTFGFPFITHTAKSLYRLLEKPEAQSQLSLELIRTHIHLLQLIFTKDYKGDHQPDVQKALKGLEIAVDNALLK